MTKFTCDPLQNGVDPFGGPLNEFGHAFATDSAKYKRMSAETVQDFRKRELPNPEFIFGSTPEMRRLRDKVEEALQDDLAVLIEGESGTGKEVIAHFLHQHSTRRQGPFVKVNCGAVPWQLLKREMFGYEADPSGRGRETRNGFIGMAADGTLFFDEIGEMDPALQQNVARILETGRYRNEEGSKELTANARFLCSSCIDPEAGDGRGLVLGELLKCLPHRIRLVPLRERKADIPQICEYLLEKFARNFGRPAPGLSQAVLDTFNQWDWPGNIRELENWIARIVMFGTEDAIGMEFGQLSAAWINGSPRRHRATHVNGSRVTRARRRG
jgi:DNA-binding NtrC family response regulator